MHTNACTHNAHTGTLGPHVSIFMCEHKHAICTHVQTVTNQMQANYAVYKHVATCSRLFWRIVISPAISWSCQTRDQNIITFSTHAVSFVFNKATRGSQWAKAYSHAGLFQLAFSCAVWSLTGVNVIGRPLSPKRFLCPNTCRHSRCRFCLDGPLANEWL